MSLNLEEGRKLHNLPLGSKYLGYASAIKSKIYVTHISHSYNFKSIGLPPSHPADSQSTINTKLLSRDETIFKSLLSRKHKTNKISTTLLSPSQPQKVKKLNPAHKILKKDFQHLTQKIKHLLVSQSINYPGFTYFSSNIDLPNLTN